MRIPLRYYPRILRTTYILLGVSVCLLLYIHFFVRSVSERDPEIQSALDIIDHDAPAALDILNRYIPHDRDNAARAEALRSFARFIIADTNSRLDTAVIITLRENGRQDGPFLGRALLAYGAEAADRGHLQIAVNALGETSERALTQLSDTLLAARANRRLGYAYHDIFAFETGVEHFSKARDLFDALNDSVRADICRRAIARLLGMSFDRNSVRRAVAILDSMEQRVENVSDRDEKRYFTRLNIQPRLRSGDYDGAIKYGRKLLDEYEISPQDSLWAYALMSKASIKQKHFREAREWLDSAKCFGGLISRKAGGHMISLTGIELELIDSMNPDATIKRLRSTFDTENDSLFTLYKSNIGLLTPSYSLAVEVAGNQDFQLLTTIAIIIIIFCLIVLSSLFFSSTNKLRIRLASLQNDYDELSQSSASLTQKIVETELEAESLNTELLKYRNDNLAIYKEIAEYKQQIAEKESIINNLIKSFSDIDYSDSERTSGENFSPYIPAINSILLQLLPRSTGDSKHSVRSTKVSSKLLAYLRSDNFESSLIFLALKNEPELSRFSPELLVLLGKELYNILLMLVAGFSLHSIGIVMAMGHSAVYRRRNTLEDLLLSSKKDYYFIIAEKYIRHNNNSN